ncbi:MAG: tetratricopeptide repeat protein [Cyclobacteriaceae bacterium]
MKAPITLLLTFVTMVVHSQNTVEKYVREGIQYHDAGDYRSALEAYQHALYLNPRSSLANYEMAMTYSVINEYDSALKYADIVIELNDNSLIPAYIVKGNTLDDLGHPHKAIKTYKTGLRRVGKHHLLYYNMALTHFTLKDHKSTEKALVKAIKNNPTHGSSHLLLGQLLFTRDQPVQSLLALYYFLLLEPNTNRSAGAYQLVSTQLTGSAERDGNNINILVPASKNKKEDFSAAALMLSMFGAMNLSDENKDQTPEEQFVTNTKSFFTILGELKGKKKRGLWWKFYVPFFYDLARTDHLETYCYYISQSSNQNAITWLDSHIDRIEALDQWLRE